MHRAEGVEAAERPSTGISRRRSLTIALALAAATFVANLALAHRMDDLKAFRQYDVLFNADIAPRLRCMVRNQCGGRSSFAHPNLAVFLNPPVQAVAGLLALGGLTGIDTASARRSVALCVSPLASAAKSAAVFALLLGLGLGALPAGLLAALSAVSFSQLVFGAIPESFAVSGLLIALTYLLASRAMRSGDRRLWPWILIGILLTGVTLSNLAVLVVLFAATRIHAGERLRALVAPLAVVVGCVLLPTAALPKLFEDTYGLAEVSLAGGAEYTKRWWKPERALERSLSLPSALAHTFAAPEPELGRNLPALVMGSRYPYRFVVAHREDVFCFRHPLGFLLVVLFVAGALGHRRGPADARWLCGASLVIIAFNWALHSVWGVDLILYSQHWQLSLLLLLAGLFFWTPPLVRKLSLGFAALTLAVVVQNAQTVAAMLSTLQSDHRGSGEPVAAEPRLP